MECVGGGILLELCWLLVWGSRWLGKLCSGKLIRCFWWIWHRYLILALSLRTLTLTLRIPPPIPLHRNNHCRCKAHVHAIHQRSEWEDWEGVSRAGHQSGLQVREHPETISGQGEEQETRRAQKRGDLRSSLCQMQPGINRRNWKKPKWKIEGACYFATFTSYL